MLEEDAQDAMGGPMALQMQTPSVDDVRKKMKDPVGCTKIITTLDSFRQQRLKQRIHNRLKNTTSKVRPGEKLSTYLRRRCNRDESSAGERFASVSDSKNKKKTKKTKKSKHQERLDKDKWGEEKSEGTEIRAEDNEFFDGFVMLSEDAETEEIENYIGTTANVEDDGNDGECGFVDFLFDEDEIIMLMNERNDAERVRVLRELGDGPTVHVTKNCEDLSCNCETYNRWRICRHIAWIKVLHFGKYPPGEISDAEDGWGRIREKILEIIKKTHINVSA